jgi:hypothetical protein
LPPDVVQVEALAERADDSQQLPPPAEGGGTVHDHQMVHGCDEFCSHEFRMAKPAIKIICKNASGRHRRCQKRRREGKAGRHLYLNGARYADASTACHSHPGAHVADRHGRGSRCGSGGRGPHPSLSLRDPSLKSTEGHPRRGWGRLYALSHRFLVSDQPLQAARSPCSSVRRVPQIRCLVNGQAQLTNSPAIAAFETSRLERFDPTTS